MLGRSVYLENQIPFYNPPPPVIKQCTIVSNSTQIFRLRKQIQHAHTHGCIYNFLPDWSCCYGLLTEWIDFVWTGCCLGLLVACVTPRLSDQSQLGRHLQSQICILTAYTRILMCEYKLAAYVYIDGTLCQV